MNESSDPLNPNSADPTPSASGEGKKNSGRIWPILIVGFLVSSAALDLTVLYIASQHPSLAIEDDYYQRGLERESRDESRTAADLRGWSFEPLIPDRVIRRQPNSVQAKFVDSAGAPIVGAKVRFRAFPSSRPRQVQEVEMKMVDGVYQGEFTPSRQGAWQFRFEVEHEDLTFEEVKEPWIYWVR